MTKPRVLVLPGPTMYHDLFAPDIDAALRDLPDPRFATVAPADVP